MKLTKIQKFLTTNNINFKYTENQYCNTIFGDISIKDNKTKFISIAEVTGKRGSTVSEIMVYFKDKETGRLRSYSASNQTSIIDRIQSDINKKARDEE